MNRRWWCGGLAGLLLAFATPLVAQDAAGTAAAPDLVVLHFNDFHGQIRPRLVVRRPGSEPVPRGGFAALEALVARRRAEHGDRLWVTNGGDWFQGTPEGNEDRGASVMACLERLGLTASVLGNHEYDFGERHLQALVKGLRHPVLAANVLERGTQRLRPYVRPYVIKTVRPVAGEGVPQRVALVGLVTADTPQVSTGPFGAAEFEAEAKTLERLLPELRREADHVVLLSHCGVRRDRELAVRFPGISLILGGHSHTSLRRPVLEGSTVIVQSGSRAGYLTEVALRVTSAGCELLSFDFIELEAGGAIEPATAQFLEQRFAPLAAKWDTALGTVRGAADRRVGAGSSPAGSFVSALMRRAGGAEVGLTNKGGLRKVLMAGAVTRRDVFELVPFDNAVVTFEMTGAQLCAVLSHALRPGRRPLEIDGATYSYSIEDGARQLERVEVGGALITRDRIYTVATNSFLAGGGDGQSEFAAAREIARTTEFLRDLLVDHLARTGGIELPSDARIRVEKR